MAAVALALTGCSGSGSPNSLETDVTGVTGVTGPTGGAEVLAPDLGQIGVSVDPGSLECAEAELTQGASVACTFTANGQPVGLTALVKSVDGSKVEYEISTEAKPVPAAVLADAVKARVGQELGSAASSATCVGDLNPETGASTTCTIKKDSESRDVVVEVESIDGGQINYTIGAA